MLAPPKSAPLPRKMYASTTASSPEEVAGGEVYGRVSGLVTLKRTKSTVKSVKKLNKYPFVKKRPLFAEYPPNGHRYNVANVKNGVNKM